MSYSDNINKLMNDSYVTPDSLNKMMQRQLGEIKPDEERVEIPDSSVPEEVLPYYPGADFDDFGSQESGSMFVTGDRPKTPDLFIPNLEGDYDPEQISQFIPDGTPVTPDYAPPQSPNSPPVTPDGPPVTPPFQQGGGGVTQTGGAPIVNVINNIGSSGEVKSGEVKSGEEKSGEEKSEGNNEDDTASIQEGDGTEPPKPKVTINHFTHEQKGGLGMLQHNETENNDSTSDDNSGGKKIIF